MDVVSAGIARLLPSLPSPHRILQLPFFLNSLTSHREASSSSSPQANIDSSISLQSTCKSPSLSCPSTLPSPVNTCCLNHPSGHFLLAQFWDTSPPLGPNDSWTLHGLWPDYCTGGYPANCDRSRDLNRYEIAGIVNSAAKTTHPDLESYMNTYWKGLHGDDDLWSHEWNKHGTCVSTLETKCYDDDDNYDQTASHLTPTHIDLLDYLSAATTLHSTLDTYSLLASHGIIPSYTSTYTLSQITNALTSHPTWTLHHPLATQPKLTHPHTSHHAPSSSLLTATIKCHHGALDEIWMHFTTAGHLRNTTAANVHDRFVPAAPDTLGRSTCPQTGIKYLPKNAPTGTHTAPPAPGPTSTVVPKPFEGKGFLNVHVLDSDSDSDDESSAIKAEGEELEAAVASSCLIRRGDWFTSGQCARYLAKTDVDSPSSSAEEHLFTLTSSFAPCGMQNGRFVCAPNLAKQDIFSASAGGDGDDSEEKRNVLTWRNQTVFYADRVPGRFEKVGVFTDDGEGRRAVSVEIWWEAV